MEKRAEQSASVTLILAIATVVGGLIVSSPYWAIVIVVIMSFFIKFPVWKLVIATSSGWLAMNYSGETALFVLVVMIFVLDMISSAIYLHRRKACKRDRVE